MQGAEVRNSDLVIKKKKPHSGFKIKSLGVKVQLK